MNEEQKKALSEPLNAAHVSKRKGSGNFTLSYVEGWWAISEANRIFGFDGWIRETVDLRMVQETQAEIGRNKEPGWRVAYVCKSRVTVGEIVREGMGYGQGIDRDLGAAHESAVKECETDAMKRALMTFGNPFGLALYDKTQANVTQNPSPNIHPPAGGKWPTKTAITEAAQAFSADIAACEDEMTLDALLDSHSELIEEIKSRAPSWWAGKPGTDFLGYSAQIANKRAEFMQREGLTP